MTWISIIWPCFFIELYADHILKDSLCLFIYLFTSSSCAQGCLTFPLLLVYVLMYYKNPCCIGIKFILLQKLNRFLRPVCFVECSTFLDYLNNLDIQKMYISPNI